ncbi:hypothetical protein BC831DRAFT_458076 [Entophlyctis helioformis]|nr:hypothetical protein BC831DRAFT_458076 [Entophlyctis helioformis]
MSALPLVPGAPADPPAPAPAPADAALDSSAKFVPRVPANPAAQPSQANAVPDAALGAAARLADTAASTARQSSSSSSSSKTVYKPSAADLSAGALNPLYDHFAVALKTGRDVALQRTPVQLLTYLAPIRNLIIIGEAPGVRVGHHDMIDVYTGLYANLSVPDPLADLISAKPKSRRDDQPEAPTLDKRADDAVKPDEGSLGWKADAHKNFPGFRELWTRFPNADWYIMLDDDTYFFFDNLKELLDKYDPNQPHYIGSHNMFIGCDGVKAWGEGPGFAHGGSGIVISRGAMAKMMSNLNECIVKYMGCWAGDIRVALCLRDHKIFMTDPSGFYRDPPNDDFWFTKDACHKPISFHHLLVKQIQKLGDLDQRLRKEGKPLNMAAVYHDWHPSPPAMASNTDRTGGDLRHFALPDAGACRKECLDDKQCTAYVFTGSECWLKNAIPNAKPKDGYTSGVVPQHFQCLTTTKP